METNQEDVEKNTIEENVLELDLPINVVSLEASEEKRELIEIGALKSTLADIESGDKHDTLYCNISNAEVLFEVPIELNSEPIKCQVCPALFSVQSDLDTHMSVHDGKKQFNAQAAADESSKKFECQFEFCDSKFKTKRDCERHIKFVHEGLKPFQCSKCTLSFKTSGDLNRHFRSKHEDEKKFKCDECPYQTARHYQLKNHKKKIHDLKSAN